MNNFITKFFLKQKKQDQNEAVQQPLNPANHRSASNAIDLFDYRSILDDEMLLTILTKNHFIINLNLSNCALITDTGINYIAELSPKLQVLNVYGCSKITGEGIKNLITRCLNLHILNLAGCNISPVELKSIRENSPQLKQLIMTTEVKIDHLKTIEARSESTSY